MKFVGGSALLEPSLDDGEIVVQARRSAKVINMIQEFVQDFAPTCKSLKPSLTEFSAVCAYNP